MNIDTTILGYIIESEVICDDCAESNDGYTVELLSSPETTVLNVYNTADWSDSGLTCGDCHEYIVEPYEPEEVEEDNDLCKCGGDLQVIATARGIVKCWRCGKTWFTNDNGALLEETPWSVAY